MDIKGKKVLILGGYGLVGYEVARKILLESPSQLILVSLKKEETQEAISNLKKEFGEQVEFVGEHGNIFTTTKSKDIPLGQVRSDPKRRRENISEIFDELNEKKLEEFFLYQLIIKHKPHLIVDAVNTATAISYQNIFEVIASLRQVTKTISDHSSPDPSASKEELQRYIQTLQKNSQELVRLTEICLSSMYIPQLLRHLQVLYNGFQTGHVKVYLKVGTSGTGGMGLNIPYTHGEEEHPSRLVMSKAALAGAHTLLLFLMSRTPKTPIIKEIKPTAAIGWKEIKWDKIQKGNRTLWLYKPVREKIAHTLRLEYTKEDNQWRDFAGEDLSIFRSVYVDLGESGLYSRGEFEVLTSLHQMELITADEVSQHILHEIHGMNTGRDMINALDSAVLGPSYRAGFLRHQVLNYMRDLEKQHPNPGVAFEMLGPPRISKLLFECHLLKLVYKKMAPLMEDSPAQMAEKVEALLLQDSNLISQIISIGIPILLSSGEELLRGPEIKIPFHQTEKEIPLTAKDIDSWSKEGWIDLRTANMEKWKNRFELIQKEVKTLGEPSCWRGSSKKGQMAETEQGHIEIGEIVGWILNWEEKGWRVKD